MATHPPLDARNAGDEVRWDETFDLVVLGAGAAGMTAALVASLAGLRPLVIEASAQVGGTTARSSGTVWIPDNPEQRARGIDDDAQRARTYLDALVADRADPALRDMFVAQGRRMIEHLASHTDIAFYAYWSSPDYRQDLPGAAPGGRPLEPLPFDGRTLGDAFQHVAAPLPELTLFGGMMVTRGEAARLLRIGRSLDALALGARLTTRYLVDRLRYRRGTRLVLGNALAARLYRNLVDRHVPVWRSIHAERLVRDASGVVGVMVRRLEGSCAIRAVHGVVLAGGGFPADAQWRKRHLPAPVAQFTPAFERCEGTTLQLALDVGAALGPDGLDNALWFPSSLASRRDGSTMVYPHIVLDRAKPGLIAVNSAGMRFVDEAVSYHEFVRAMYRSHAVVPTIPAYLVCDRAFVWRYGLGAIRPRTPALGRYLRNGYLKMASTVPELARVIGVDARALGSTIARNNEYAGTGVDAEFAKGSNLYDRANGDPEHHPNPCLGPIAKPPFCAVAVYPTPLGTSLGLRTDTSARVCDGRGHAIPGLYACGNDMHSPFGGEYPGAGAQIGVAMTFGYIAATHAAAAARAGATSIPEACSPQ